MEGNSTFYTIGHSTRSVEEMVDLVREVGVDFVADVRTIPRSRANPQFNAGTLTDVLAGYQIGYSHLKRLGGLRGRLKGHGPSKNTFWKNVSFRNYADYADTPTFREGLSELRTLGRAHVCVIMCAEAVWWRCHRRIIADYLLSDGQDVFHIISLGRVERARMNPAAIRQPDSSLLYVDASAPIENRASANG